MPPKKVLLAPLDPVHDIALKIINRGLRDAGYETVILPPDLPPEEIIQAIIDEGAETVLISRTLGYGVAEVLARFIDLTDAAGIRDRVRVAVGGMAVHPELAQELGFDAGFGPGSTVEETIAFVDGREYVKKFNFERKREDDLSAGYSYEVRHNRIRELLGRITPLILGWAEGLTSPGVQRAAVREELWDVKKWRDHEEPEEFFAEYPKYCEESVRNFYEKGLLHPKTRLFSQKDVEKLKAYVRRSRRDLQTPHLQHKLIKPVIFNQYGTGCPYMDIAHIKASEAYGADGVIHFDPSWGARTEGLYDGFLTHQEDGTVITPANLNRIYRALEYGTLWQVRAHRGLNSPETVVLAGKIGANLTKINICYGSLGAGTDPARLTVDAIAAIKYAVQYQMPFDVVTNEELCGVPAHKALAGMLIVAHLGAALGGRPILQPLFCFSPEVMIGGQMDDNYVDFNVAKIMALRAIMDAPIWPGAPIGFLTQTEDRVQSSASTAFHASLAAMLEVDAISIASADEAYSGGPITVASRIDTLRAVSEGFRFFGHSRMQVSAQATEWAEKMIEGLERVLQAVAARGDFVQALYDGLLGSREEGAYPGRAGVNTVVKK
ncbi:MAG: cobalamin-dependent protein [Candidatus Adiutrix sp.]|jgi:methylmalonyl-CoA mutase cobalamin-binding domain/chain|nr:cobalamin-dependent protein [Candidatus Adiutrix sp.]